MTQKITQMQIKELKTMEANKLNSNSSVNYRPVFFCIVTMFFWFAMYTYVPVFAAYVEELGASHKLAGIIVGSYGFTQMMLRIPVGIISDRLHKRRMFISLGLLFTFLSSAGLSATTSLTLILVFRALAGAAAATWVGFTVLYTSYFKHEESVKAIGVINFFTTIGQMTAMLAGGWVAQNISTKATFSLGALAGLIGLGASFFIVEKYEPQAEKITFKGIIELLKNHTLLCVSSLAVLSQLITFATVFGFTPVFARNIGASRFEMSILTVVSSLPAAIASLAAGKYLAKKFGEKTIVITGFILTGIFTLIIPFTKSFPLLLATQVFSGFGRGLSFTLLMGLSIKDVRSDRRATAMGFFQAIYGLGMFLGPVFLGTISDLFSLEQGFVAMGLTGIATAAISYILLEKSFNPALPE